VDGDKRDAVNLKAKGRIWSHQRNQVRFKVDADASATAVKDRVKHPFDEKNLIMGVRPLLISGAIVKPEQGEGGH